MSNHLPQQETPAANIVETGPVQTHGTQPPPGEQISELISTQASEKTESDQKQAQMIAAGLTAMAGVRILTREEEAGLAERAAEEAAEGQHQSHAQWSPQPGLLAKTVAWCILIFFGLGSIVLLSLFIFSMARG